MCYCLNILNEENDFQYIFFQSHEILVNESTLGFKAIWLKVNDFQYSFISGLNLLFTVLILIGMLYDLC